MLFSEVVVPVIQSNQGCSSDSISLYYVLQFVLFIIHILYISKQTISSDLFYRYILEDHRTQKKRRLDSSLVSCGPRKTCTTKI